MANQLWVLQKKAQIEQLSALLAFLLPNANKDERSDMLAFFLESLVIARGMQVGRGTDTTFFRKHRSFRVSNNRLVSKFFQESM